MSASQRTAARVPEEGDYLTVAGTARRFKIHPDTVRNWIHQGVPFVDVGARRTSSRRRNRSLRFSISAVETWLAARGGGR